MIEYEYEIINNKPQLDYVHDMYLIMSLLLHEFNEKDYDIIKEEITDDISIRIFPYLDLIVDNNNHKVYAIHEYTHTILMSKHTILNEIDNTDRKIINSIEKYIKDDVYTMTDMYCDIYNRNEYIDYVNEVMQIPNRLTYYIDYNQILYDMQINGDTITVKVYYVNEKYEVEYINLVCVLKKNK